MYQIGDQVVYGIHGVCRIKEKEKQVVDRKTVTYLVLEPIGQEGTRYLVPTHNQNAMAKLRPVLTVAELESLLNLETIRTDGWISDESQRKQLYRELISLGDRASLLRMVFTLHRHRKVQTEAGRKVHLADENFLRDAEKLLLSEIAVVTGLSHAEAKQYLQKKLNTE